MLFKDVAKNLWKIFDCCGRCSIDDCEATNHYFSENDSKILDEMTNLEREMSDTKVVDDVAKLIAPYRTFLMRQEIAANTEWLETTEGDEVECISIENLKAILEKYSR